MSSLKEIKGRIASVQSTQKITSAMRMVASAKLHKTQGMTERFLRYKEELKKIVEDLNLTIVRNGEGGEEYQFETTDDNATATVTAPSGTNSGVVMLITISSNSGLCGAFNSNIAKATFKRKAELEAQGYEVRVIPVGKKIAHELKKADVSHDSDFMTLMERVEKGDGYGNAAKIMDSITKTYNENPSMQVELIYHHFKSMGSQIVTIYNLALHTEFKENPKRKATSERYLTEPSVGELIKSLHPRLMLAEI